MGEPKNRYQLGELEDRCLAALGEFLDGSPNSDELDRFLEKELSEWVVGRMIDGEWTTRDLVDVAMVETNLFFESPAANNELAFEGTDETELTLESLILMNLEHSIGDVVKKELRRRGYSV